MGYFTNANIAVSLVTVTRMTANKGIVCYPSQSPTLALTLILTLTLTLTLNLALYSAGLGIAILSPYCP